MIKVSTIAIAGGTLVMAAAIGVFMQTGQQDTSSFTPATPVETETLSNLPKDAQTPGSIQETPVQLAAITLTSSDVTRLPDTMTKAAQFPLTPILVATGDEDMLEAGNDTAASDAKEPLSEPRAEQGCFVDLAAETRAAAMVALKLSAPCQPNARVVFHHEGMKFTSATDDAGYVQVLVPALAEQAAFLAMMDDGNGAAVEVEVGSLSFYDRSIVQWRGDAGVSIHALEFGADYKDAGHVWAGAPRDAKIAAVGEGGFVTRLGDTSIDGANMADVYTFPTGTAKASGDVQMSVEVEVTELNCGREVTAEVLQVSDAVVSEPSLLSVTVPDCDAVGDFLLLKNLVDDLKIASRS